eukprot:1153345-Pelagomonas_calceolata.AAC.9
MHTDGIVDSKTSAAAAAAAAGQEVAESIIDTTHGSHLGSGCLEPARANKWSTPTSTRDCATVKKDLG